MITKITNNDMQAVLAGDVAVIDFSAGWCGPCKMLHPVLEELSEEMKEVAFYNADVDENMDLAVSMGVTNIPALFLYKKGEKKGNLVGYHQKNDLKAWICS